MSVTVLKTSNSISADRKDLIVTDDTGIYSSGDNPTGWYGPNTDPSAITEAVVYVSVNGGEEKAYNVFTDGDTYVPNELPAGFEIVIHAGFFGATDEGKVPDGYIRTRTVLGPVPLSANAIMFNDANVCCCVKKLQDSDPDLSGCGCGGATSAIPISMEAYQYLRNLEAAVNAGKYNRAQVYLKLLQEICDKHHCNC